MTLEEIRKLAEIRNLAEVATPGPWEHYAGHVFKSGDGSANVASVSDPWAKNVVGYSPLDLMRQDAFRQAMANADFIAAASPVTVLKLLEIIEIYKPALEAVIAPSHWSHTARTLKAKQLIATQALSRAGDIERSLGE